MTELKCGVYSCANQKNNMCCKPNINIDGKNACCCDETCCSDYVQKGDENNTGYSDPNRQLNISCSAKECMYNHSDICRAGSVNVSNSGGGAVCSTFVKK